MMPSMANEKLPDTCRFRGTEMHLADARMQLTSDELAEVEVTLEDGKVVRPFRFNEVDPEIKSNEHGVLSF